MPNIFAVVVSYNGLRWYDRCLGSLRDSDIPVHTIVIDNDSSDNSRSFIEERFPEVILIKSKENVGFAKANNIGISYAIDHNADFVFLLNQDAWVEKNTLSELLKSFEENENVGIASPVHLNGSYTALDHGFVNYMGGDFASDAYFQKLKDYYERPFLNAAAWLINRRCIETVGGFDTLLFSHYGEDDNYCQRVLYHGFKIIVCTRCTICHDRENRKEKDPKYQTISRRTSYLSDRIKFGNINCSFNLDNDIKNLKWKMRKKLIMGKFSSAKAIREKISVFHRIEQSREINKLAGKAWL